jgi:hypothetical protein
MLWVLFRMLIATALVTSLLSAQRVAGEPITFQCTFSDGTPCIAVPGIPDAWINPVMGENEPVSERSMAVQVFGATFTTSPQLYDIFEPDGSVSDQILITNANNRGTIVFSSEALCFCFR